MMLKILLTEQRYATSDTAAVSAGYACQDRGDIEPHPGGAGVFSAGRVLGIPAVRRSGLSRLVGLSASPELLAPFAFAT